jgi:hypothetical protein
MSFSAPEHLVWHHCTEQTRDGFLCKNAVSTTNNKERKLTEESLTAGFQGLSTQASAWWFVTVLPHFASLRPLQYPTYERIIEVACFVYRAGIPQSVWRWATG